MTGPGRRAGDGGALWVIRQARKHRNVIVRYCSMAATLPAVAPADRPGQSAAMPAENPKELLEDGAARHARGDYTGAELRYRRVLALRPQDANAHNLLGVLARQRGDVT